MVERLPVVLDARVVTGAGGGPEKTILNSPRFLKPLGYRMVCAYLHPPGDPGFEVLRQKADQLQAPLESIPDRGPWDWRVFRKLLAVCRREQVAIYHGHDYKSNALGLLLRRFHRMRLVTTAHGWVKHTSRTPLYYRIDKFCLPRYEKVICVSSDLVSECHRIGVREQRCLLLENGIDLAAYERTQSIADAKVRLGFDPWRPLIGAVGRLSAEKGFDLLIQAVDGLRRQTAMSPVGAAPPSRPSPPPAMTCLNSATLGRGRGDGREGVAEPLTPTPLPALEAADKSRDADWRGEGRDTPSVSGLREVQQSSVPPQLVIVGDGDERGRLQAMLDERNLRADVRLAGFQTDPKPFYEAMDLFALSSLREGLPNVLLEAMALAVPCVATRIAGIPLVIQDGVNGRLIEAGNITALTEALREMLADESGRQRIGAAGRATVEAGFSFARRMEKLAAIYDELLGTTCSVS